VDDARIDELVRELEERPLVRVEFAATLHDRLADDLGFGHGARRGRSRFAGLARSGPWVSAGSPLHIAWIVATVALLAVALVGIFGIGSRLLAPDPEELVRLSLATYAKPPAFVETFRDAVGSAYRLSADGAGTWRIEGVQVDGGTDLGSYDLYDGVRLGHYDGPGRVWTAGTLAEMSGGVPPFPFNNEFTWSRIETGADGSVARVQAPCNGVAMVGEALVAGRATDHLRCQDSGLEIWLDRETHLILRLEAGADTPNWEPGAAITVTAFSLDSPADTTAFSFDGPADALTSEEQPPSNRLKIGDVLPDLSGPLVGGGTFNTTALRGRPAAIFVWCPCVRGAEMRRFSDAVGRRADRLAAAVVLEATADEAAAIVADVSFDGPAIIDETGVIEPLGLNYWPVLVLVDAEGRIASLSHQVKDPAELDAMLDALLAGKAIPAPTWIPGPAEAPAASTTLEIGEMAPDWSVLTDDGRTFGLGDLVGTPTIVYYGLPQGGDDFDAQNDEILRGLDRVGRRDRGVRAVVVDAVAATTDAAHAALDELSVDLPLVADRDGVIGEAWGLSYYPSLVFLDQAGRVAWYGAGTCLDLETLVQAFEVGSPMPSPALELTPSGCP